MDDPHFPAQTAGGYLQLGLKTTPARLEKRGLKRPAIAAVLSLLLPGLGHVYAGALGTAVLFLLLDAIGSAALELGALAGAAGIMALVIGKPLLKVFLRGVALAHSARQPEGRAPAGAYAFFVIASILLPFGLGSITARYVTSRH